MQGSPTVSRLEELRTEDLHHLPPPPSADVALRSILESLRGEDWAAQFEAVNGLRRM